MKTVLLFLTIVLFSCVRAQQAPPFYKDILAFKKQDTLQAPPANKKIQAWLKTQKNAQFIDVYDAMLDDKMNMREELYVADRLHMKPEGYAIWKKIIIPYLKK